MKSRLCRIGLAGVVCAFAATASAGTTNLSATDILRSLAPIAPSAGAVTPTDPAATAKVRSKVKNLRKVKIAPVSVGDPAIQLDLDMDRSVAVDVLFDYDSARLPRSATLDLDELGKALVSVELRDSRFLVSGHTDAAGSITYNEDLSRRRAAAVRDYLLAHFAIEPSRLVAAGFGPAFLRDPDHPFSGRNRRVEVVLIVETH